MKLKILLFTAVLAIGGCATKSTSGASYSADTSITADDYGYAQKNPIKVGGFSEGPANERKYLDRLTGPNGEEVTYIRRGSCCGFETPNSSFGMGMLDIYEVTIEGDPVKKVLYLNMYDKDKLHAPKGFVLKQ